MQTKKTDIPPSERCLFSQSPVRLSSHNLASFYTLITVLNEGVGFRTHLFEGFRMAGIFSIRLGKKFGGVGGYVTLVGLPVESPVFSDFLPVDFPEGGAAALELDVYGIIPDISGRT